MAETPILIWPIKNELGQHSPGDIPFILSSKVVSNTLLQEKSSVPILVPIFGTCYLRTFEMELLSLLCLFSYLSIIKMAYAVSHNQFSGKRLNQWLLWQMIKKGNNLDLLLSPTLFKMKFNTDYSVMGRYFYAQYRWR